MKLARLGPNMKCDARAAKRGIKGLSPIASRDVPSRQQLLHDALASKGGGWSALRRSRLCVTAVRQRLGALVQWRKAVRPNVQNDTMLPAPRRSPLWGVGKKTLRGYPETTLGLTVYLLDS